ncbi:MAG: hypothetical protein AAF682_08510 [Planctomycetota bacterium]
MQSIAVRPAAAGQGGELSALLREGRVLAGEVLRSMSGGGVLIGIGRHRVPAHTDVRLDPGQRFLFQVERSAGRILLRVLGDDSGGEAPFLRLLRAVIGQDRPVGELLQELLVRARAEQARPGAGPEQLGRLLADVEGHLFRAGAGGEELRALLQSLGGRYEAALLTAALRGGAPGELLAALTRDLKGQLLAALRDLPEGPLREAVARALAGIEAEQLLNLARAHSGDPQVWSFPLADADGWTTAHLLIPPREEPDERRRGESDAEPDAETQRFVLGVSFSRMGPVRADLLLSPDALRVRLTVTRAELAERIERDLPALIERLGDGRRAVHVVAALGTSDDAAVSVNPVDIGLLHDHRMMDVSG